MNWFNAIRGARFAYLKMALSPSNDSQVWTFCCCTFYCKCLERHLSEFYGGFQQLFVSVFLFCFFLLSYQLLPLLTRSSLKEGFMEKTGPKVGLVAISAICNYSVNTVCFICFLQFMWQDQFLTVD